MKRYCHDLSKISLGKALKTVMPYLKKHCNFFSIPVVVNDNEADICSYPASVNHEINQINPRVPANRSTYAPFHSGQM